jgi:nitrate/TMAO reductase-like tetraheme cytochrome c subunit
MEEQKLKDERKSLTKTVWTEMAENKAETPDQ